MTSLFDWLRGARSDDRTRSDSDAIRRIVGELDKLPPERAKYLAAFSYLLSRVAGADSHFSDEETAKMVEILAEVGRLPEPQATLVVEIAKSQNRLFGGTENFLVVREFREVASDEERRDLLQCLFAVASADEAITPDEDAQIWQIAGEIGVTHADFVKIRLSHSDKRTVLRREPRE
jgi:uncharacterized tellurite resistance protein B-like protein